MWCAQREERGTPHTTVQEGMRWRVREVGNLPPVPWSSVAIKGHLKHKGRASRTAVCKGTRYPFGYMIKKNIFGILSIFYYILRLTSVSESHIYIYFLFVDFI